MPNPKAPRKPKPEDVPASPVEAVSAWIRNNPDRARVAWQAEKDRAGQPRKGVVDAVKSAGVRVKA